MTDRPESTSRSLTWGSWLVCGAGLVVASLIFTGTLRPMTWGKETTGADERRADRQAEPPMIFAGGIVEGPHRELPLQFEMGGRLKAVHVRPGQVVRAGTPLAELDSLLIERLVYEAHLRLRMARVQRAESGAESRAQLADPARTTYASASPAVMPQAPAPSPALLADQEELAASALKREQLNLEKCILRAPHDGVVLETSGQVGELVGPASERPLVTMVGVGPRHVRAFVEELDALDVAPGQQASVQVAGKPEQRYRGKVVECLPYVRPKSHRHLRPGERLDVRVREVLIRLEDADELLVGLPVEVHLRLPQAASDRAAVDRDERF